MPLGTTAQSASIEDSNMVQDIKKALHSLYEKPLNEQNHSMVATRKYKNQGNLTMGFAALINYASLCYMLGVGGGSAHTQQIGNRLTYGHFAKLSDKQVDLFFDQTERPFDDALAILSALCAGYLAVELFKKYGLTEAQQMNAHTDKITFEQRKEIFDKLIDNAVSVANDFLNNKTNNDEISEWYSLLIKAQEEIAEKFPPYSDSSRPDTTFDQDVARINDSYACMVGELKDKDLFPENSLKYCLINLGKMYETQLSVVTHNPFR